MRVVMGLVFYPRGGSAQVVRYLSRALGEHGHDVKLLVGTLRDGNPEHDARVFYDGLDLVEVDYTDAWRAHQIGRDPMRNLRVQMHPSYEDKPDVPDRSFGRVGDGIADALVDCWSDALRSTAAFSPDVLHLHHLNHMHLAADGLRAPKAAHLHGTEIKMLESFERGPSLPHADAWRARLERAARGMDHFFAISPDVRQRGVQRFGIDEPRVTTIPNGVDTEWFRPRQMGAEEKLAMLHRILVAEPRGWREGGKAGSIAYDAGDLTAFRNPAGGLRPLVLFVGRFLGFKRVPLLMEAVAEVNARFDGEPPFNLLVWGGMPGEWEGEHPHTAAERLRLRNVFFCGWLPHTILAEGLGLADVFVAPSYYEPFGQVFLEAMATGLPVIATRSGGPLSFVAGEGDRPNGWFCDVDDVESLADALHAAIADVGERRRRGENAKQLIRGQYSWAAIALRFAEVYERLRG